MVGFPITTAPIFHPPSCEGRRIELIGFGRWSGEYISDEDSTSQRVVPGPECVFRLPSFLFFSSESICVSPGSVVRHRSTVAFPPKIYELRGIGSLSPSPLPLSLLLRSISTRYSRFAAPAGFRLFPYCGQYRFTDTAPGLTTESIPLVYPRFFVKNFPLHWRYSTSWILATFSPLPFRKIRR